MSSDAGASHAGKSEVSPNINTANKTGARRKRSLSPPLFVPHNGDNKSDGPPGSKRAKLLLDAISDDGTAGPGATATTSQSTSDVQADPLDNAAKDLHESLDQGDDEDDQSESDDEDNDNDDEDEDEDRVAPYHTKTMEALPRIAVFHESFVKAEELISNICEQSKALALNAKERGLDVPELSVILIDDNAGLQRFRNASDHYEISGPAALYGISGVGKSSTINSLLDTTNAAFENSSKRGTYLPTEYRRAGIQQTSAFAIFAPYLRPDQRTSLIRQNVKSISDFIRYEDGDEDEEEEEEEEQDAQHLRDAAAASVEFFVSLFCNDRRLKDKATCMETFRGFLGGEHGPDELVEWFVAMLDKHLSKRDLRDGVEQYAASDEKSLARIVKAIATPSTTASKASKTPSLWPITDKIEIRLDHALLNAGVVLADLAGHNDTNLTVVQNTRRYISKAGLILLFANHKRIESDATLEAQLREVIAMGKADQVVLVVTQIDNLPIFPESERDELPAEGLARLVSAEKLIKKLGIEESKLKKEKKKKSTTPIRKSEISDRLEQIPGDVARAKVKAHQICIEMRCAQIEAEMSSKMKRLQKDDSAAELPVICISNTVYREHVKGYKSSDPPKLTLQATGVPALRGHLHKLAAGGKFHTLKRIATHILPNTLRGALGVLTKTPMEREGDCRHLVESQLRHRFKALHSFEQEIKLDFDRQVIQPMDEECQRYATQAQNLCQQWQVKYKAVTFTAFCRKSGHHRPSGVKKDVSLNAEIQAIYEQDVIAAFEDLFGNVATAANAVLSELTEFFRDLVEQIEGSHAFQGVDVTDFITSIRSTRDVVLADLDKHFKGLRGRLSHVRAALVQETDMSLCSIVMQPTWAEVFAMQANGYQKQNSKGKMLAPKLKDVYQKRIDRVIAKLVGVEDETSAFAEIAEKAKDLFEDKMGDWTKKAEGFIRKACDDIKRDFENRYGGTKEDVKKERQPELEEELKGALVQQLEVVEGELKGYIDACEAHEKGEVLG